MQKKLIALAIAGLSSVAFAQSNVTLYGVADVYAGHATAGKMESQNAINSGGLSTSRLGFKGSEDLGNGTKALFTLEYALAIDANTGVGTGTSAARQQFVGLTGDWGTAVAGRLQTAGYDWSGVTNALHGTAINPLLSVQGGLAAGAGLLNSSSRANNAFGYISPSFNGFSFAYNHTRITESTNLNANKKDDTANLISGTYTSGALALSAIYSKASLDSTIPTNALKEIGIGGSYDFGVVKVYGSYQTQKLDLVNKTDKAYQLSVAYPVTAAGTIIGEYARNKLDSATDKDSKSYTLAYTHALSKRTTAYAGYQHSTNDTNAMIGTALLAPVTGGESASLVVGGLRHAF